MREFPRLMTDVDCGWKDDVGLSITSYARSLAMSQQQECDALRTVMLEAERLINDNVSYQSRSSDIQACKID